MDTAGWTALHYAANAGHKEIVEFLLLQGANPDPILDKTGETPLMLAAKNGHVEVCNFMFAYSKEDRTTFTDPELVEHLINRIHEQGFSNITIAEAQSAYGNYYRNRSVEDVAMHVGYSKDKNYRIVDLTEEKVTYDFGGKLGKHPVGPTWRDADFRISFAKNKTHTFREWN